MPEREKLGLTRKVPDPDAPLTPSVQKINIEKIKSQLSNFDEEILHLKLEKQKKRRKLAGLLCALLQQFKEMGLTI